jgi:hypothetical protein
LPAAGGADQSASPWRTASAITSTCTSSESQKPAERRRARGSARSKRGADGRGASQVMRCDAA